MTKKKSVYFITFVAVLIVLALVVVFSMPFILKWANGWKDWLMYIVLPIVLGILASTLVSLWFVFIQNRNEKLKTLRYEIHEQLTYYINALPSLISILQFREPINSKKLKIHILLEKKFYVNYIDREFKSLYDEKIALIKEIKQSIDEIKTFDEYGSPSLFIDLQRLTDILLKIQDKFYEQHKEFL